MYYRYIYLIMFFFAGCLSIYAQKDSAGIKRNKPVFVLSNDSVVTFGGTRIATKTDSAEFHKLELSAYVSTYYAHYTDDTEINNFVQFPTMAPRNNQFGLNIAQIGMQYQDQNFRGNITLHYGDIPESNWPKPFTLIQEAHAGFKIVKNLWLDAGFFKTHIGIESVQPRENITSSMAVMSYYEPYFLSGAKLTYQATPKLSLQFNIFNGYNEYVENNKNKALGFSALYEFNKYFSVTYNVLTCDETPDNVKIKHQRMFHNLYGNFSKRKFSIGAEMNYGTQKNSLLTDTLKTASMFSSLLVAKYQILKKMAIYGRGEYYTDKNRIFTGSLSLGDYISGITAGIEYKPTKNTALSSEYRFLECERLIFKEGNMFVNQRHELIVCLDVWF